MQLKTYQLGLRAAANVTPYAKRISDEEIAFLHVHPVEDQGRRVG